MREGNTFKKTMDDNKRAMEACGWDLQTYLDDLPENDIYEKPTAQEIADEEEWWEETMKPIAERMKKRDYYHHIFNPTGTKGRY